MRTHFWSWTNSNLWYFDTVRLSHMQIQLSQSNSKNLPFLVLVIKELYVTGFNIHQFFNTANFLFFFQKGLTLNGLYISGSLCCESEML